MISSQQEVDLVVKNTRADVSEMTHLSSVHLQERVTAYLGEAEGTESHAP